MDNNRIGSLRAEIFDASEEVLELSKEIIKICKSNNFSFVQNEKALRITIAKLYKDALNNN